MPRAALFSTLFLPYSQTFIYEEMRQHQRYSVEVFTRRRMLEDRFPFADVHVAGPLYGYTRTSPMFDRLFAESRYDLVHAHFGTAAVYAIRWVKRHRLPMVVTFHGHDVSRLCSNDRFLPSQWRYALSSAKIFDLMTLGLCASEELRTMLLSLGVPEHKLRIHRLGIDLGVFQKGERTADAPRVIMIGNFVPKKGFDHGLRAYAKVAVAHPRAQLTIVGQGRLEGALRELSVSLGIAERVVFTGPLPPAQVASLLAQSDVLLAPSFVDRRGHRESGLIVVKEASSSQCVPIGTLHGGIPEIIDHEQTGYLVPERDVTQLAERLDALLADPALRERMGRAARAKMEREYDNRECVARLERFYDEAIALRSGSSAPATDR